MTAEHPLTLALQLSRQGNPEGAEELIRAYAAPPFDFEEAQASIGKRALEIRNQRAALYNLGWHALRRGEFCEGFEGLNHGRWIQQFGSPPIGGPIWRGEPLDGKTVLFRSEGGLGDQICNFRFARAFRDLGANVVVSASEGLAPLFSRHGFPCIAEAAHALLHYHFWVPAMSAPYVLGLDYGTLPGAAYLRASENPTRGTRKRVGLRWGGNVDQKDIEPTRKVPVAELLQAVAGIDADLFSFQRDADIVDDFPGKDLRDELGGWEDTANWLASMDLLITSCTSVAHLAAALGVETWILAPIMPYYTWALPGDRSPWYDAVRLFRQTTPGDWQQPLQEVRRRLVA